jgi:hypothetical protein
VKQHVYLLVYDRPAHFDPTKLHNFISADPGITDWWHFLESAYVLVSFQEITFLNPRFAQHFNGLSYLLMPVSLKVATGMLPRQAWDWLNSRKYLTP